MNNMVLIAAVECGHAIEKMADDPLEARLRSAMRAARGHWGVTNPDDQFMAACEAVYRTASDDEQTRIKAELESLSKVGAMLNALQAGVPVDLEQMFADREDEPEIEKIGLRALWDEVA